MNNILQSVAVVDIGGTKIKSGIWKNGQLSERRERDTQAMLGGTHVIDKVIEILSEYRGFDAVGISTAGQVDVKSGSILYANENIPGYTGMQVKTILEQRFGVPVVVENDVNSAAIGETCFGAGVGHKEFLCLTYGTGVGGAIIMNGEVYHGSGYSAGEFGAVITHPEARDAFRDTFSGCYEKYASVTALVRLVQSRFPELKNGREIFEHVNDIGVRALIDQWIREVSYGLISLIHIFNPSLVVLGGGIMEQPYVIEKVKQYVYEEIMTSFRKVEIVAAKLGNDAGMLGAAGLAAKAYANIQKMQ